MVALLAEESAVENKESNRKQIMELLYKNVSENGFVKKMDCRVIACTSLNEVAGHYTVRMLTTAMDMSLNPS